MILSRRKRTILNVLIILILVFVALLALNKKITDYLSKTKAVKANVLLIEGWISENIIESACQELNKNNYELILTTGHKAPEYYPVYMNGYLVFYTDSILNDVNSLLQNRIEVSAYSEMGRKHCAHFNFYINDSLVTDFCIGKRKRKYSINYTGNLNDIDSVMIHFDNDSMGSFGDHNIFIKEIIINNSIIIPYQYNTFHNRTAKGWERKRLNNFSTFAEIARDKLIELGINRSKIVCIPGKNPLLNRTLVSALSFRKWIEESGFEIEGINIISTGTHARRTWMIYNEILNNTYKIGIISLPENNDVSQFRKKVKTLKEILGIIYYRLVLFFY